ncbi:MAG: hypothetical protein Q9P01_17585 [Anaerolineae bacterium]|nr:hypothetical protein [Anaerolineae bacterium]
MSDYERKQYGKYEKMPAPLKPEHLREPEPKKQADTASDAPSLIGKIAAITTHSMGKVVERGKNIDWELVQVRISEISDKIRAGFKRFIEEIQFRNLQMREKVPPKFQIVVYATLALILIGIPLAIAALLFAGRGNNPDDNEVALAITAVPQNNTIIVPATQTPSPTVILPTTAPIVQASNTPLPPNTPIPPTPIPTNPPPPTDVPIVQPTTAPLVSSASIALFFAPAVQSWSSDLLRWSQTYGVDANFMAMVMQLETCGNPLYLGTEGRMGIFAVPGDRFQGAESFINPEDNARRASELMQQCYALTANDPGQAYACYRSNTDTTQASFGQWSEPMQRYFLWGFGMYGDTQNGVQSSPALNDWLVNGGGFDVCNQAQSILDSQ